MNVYSVTFLLIVLILFLCCFFKINSRVIKIAIAFFPMLVLLAFRGNNVGADTNMYLYLFDNVHSYNIFDNNLIEPSFVLLVKLLHCFTEDNQSLIIVYALFTLFSIGYLFYKYSHAVSLSIILFCSLFWLENFNTMRQCLSVPISYLAIFYLIHDRKIKFILINSLAVLIHSSSAVFFLLILLSPFSKRKLISAMLILSSLYFWGIGFGLDSFLPLLGAKYAAYFYSMDFGVGKTLGLGVIKAVAFLCVSFYVLLVAKTYSNDDIGRKEAYCMSILLFCSSIVTFLQYEMNIFSRLVYPMSFSILFLLPRLWKDFGFKRYYLYPIVVLFLFYYINRFVIVADNLEYSFFT